jgi:hypothetical protein
MATHIAGVRGVSHSSTQQTLVRRSGVTSSHRLPAHFSYRSLHILSRAHQAAVFSSQPTEEGEEDRTRSPASSDTVLGKISSWLRVNSEKSKALRDKLIGYGPAAVLAYGLFDGVSYSIAFAIAFLGYEAKTGLNPTSNVADIVKICILMWAGNNVTRPFRLAGAAALAPSIDKIMENLKNKFHLPNKLVSFFILTFLVAFVCLSGVGALIFSRWIQG